MRVWQAYRGATLQDQGDVLRGDVAAQVAAGLCGVDQRSHELAGPDGLCGHLGCRGESTGQVHGQGVQVGVDDALQESDERDVTLLSELGLVPPAKAYVY